MSRHPSPFVRRHALVHVLVAGALGSAAGTAWATKLDDKARAQAQAAQDPPPLLEPEAAAGLTAGATPQDTPAAPAHAQSSATGDPGDSKAGPGPAATSGPAAAGAQRLLMTLMDTGLQPTAMAWEARTGSLVAMVREHGRPFRIVRLSLDGKRAEVPVEAGQTLRLNPDSGIAAHPEGIVLADTGNHRLLLLAANGIVKVLAGTDKHDPQGVISNRAANASPLHFPKGVAVAQADGRILLVGTGQGEAVLGDQVRGALADQVRKALAALGKGDWKAADDLARSLGQAARRSPLLERQSVMQTPPASAGDTKASVPEGDGKAAAEPSRAQAGGAPGAGLPAPLAMVAAKTLRGRLEAFRASRWTLGEAEPEGEAVWAGPARPDPRAPWQHPYTSELEITGLALEPAQAGLPGVLVAGRSRNGLAVVYRLRPDGGGKVLAATPLPASGPQPAYRVRSLAEGGVAERNGRLWFLGRGETSGAARSQRFLQHEQACRAGRWDVAEALEQEVRSWEVLPRPPGEREALRMRVLNRLARGASMNKPDEGPDPIGPFLLAGKSLPNPVEGKIAEFASGPMDRDTPVDLGRALEAQFALGRMIMTRRIIAEVLGQPSGTAATPDPGDAKNQVVPPPPAGDAEMAASAAAPAPAPGAWLPAGTQPPSAAVPAEAGSTWAAAFGPSRPVPGAGSRRAE